MPNGFFNNQVRSSLGSGGKSPSPPAKGGKPAFNEKPGFAGGLPGKKGPDRSAGVKRAKTHPASDGL